MSMGTMLSIQMPKYFISALCVCVETERPTYIKQSEREKKREGNGSPCGQQGVYVCVLAGWVAGCQVTWHDCGEICAKRDTVSLQETKKSLIYNLLQRGGNTVADK